MVTNPFLSVIIPAYNAAPYIGATIDSVLDKTKNEHEIIVVDDGSTDATPQILRQFEDAIRIVRLDNRGLSAARNAGIEIAGGTWLAFLDGDDLWLPGFKEQMLKAANKASNETAVVCCGWQYVDSSGKVQGGCHFPDRSRLQLPGILMGNAFPVHAAITRRSVVESLRGFARDIDGLQDWDFWLRITAEGYRIEPIEQVLVSYRQVEGSMSRNSTLMRNNTLAVLDKFFGQKSSVTHIPEEVKQEAYAYARLWVGTHLYAGGLVEEGFHEFLRSFGESPLLLERRDAHYAIACAGQPRVFLGSGKFLDLDQSEQRLESVLNRVFADNPGLPNAVKRRASRLSMLTLGELALKQGKRRRSAMYGLRSLKLDGDLPALRRAARLILKSSFTKNH